MNGAIPIWVTCCGSREQSTEFLLNFESGLAPGPKLNTDSESVTTSRGWGIELQTPRVETSDIYRVSKLKLIQRGEQQASTAPWHGVPPPLPVYRERGHRRLAATTYDSKCISCIWGCAMPVEMIIDPGNPSRRRYRTETFCYGPLSCSSYKPGPTRKVPGRHGMTYEEEDRVDQDATAHRGPDE